MCISKYVPLVWKPKGAKSPHMLWSSSANTAATEPSLANLPNPSGAAATRNASQGPA